ncbi:class I SAM-dependent methyltransferase [Halalkalibacillus sediminis]|uniref:Class I SAM-dependent methyltransferase n=1 Tax=Halalkalibacillus sediminis TaxID=2018042 RepID=A0A2I0QXV9_9BACI|nr:class I SAM-dependent methyltransferase [Halalkalibacillus sediminis]PKR79171.1 class I SAM-dependent methyltransferase [Halalkalibacillus sediminis]
MQLSPHIYDLVIRPNWFNERYIHQQIKKHCDFKQKTVLDFGSGTGANCILVSPINYIGLDTDLDRIGYSRKKYPQYQFKPLHGYQLPLPNNSVDIIMIVAVLHHIPVEKIDHYITEFRRVLKNENSEVIVLEPCLLNKKCLKNWVMKKLDKGEFIQHEDSYLGYFKRAGFNVLSINKFPKGLFYNELLFKAQLK